MNKFVIQAQKIREQNKTQWDLLGRERALFLARRYILDGYTEVANHLGVSNTFLNQQLKNQYPEDFLHIENANNFKKQLPNTNFISLYKWSLREDIPYSTATKLFESGRIEGSFKEGRYTFIPEETKLPERQTIRCAICQNSFMQITETHLKIHGYTISSYKRHFPQHDVVSFEVSESISNKVSGKIRTEEHKASLSVSLIGRTAWNKGQKGVYSASEETKQKMSAAHAGYTHSEGTKQQIGNAHRGKKLSQAQIDGLRERMTGKESFFKGKKHTKKSKEKMSAAKKGTINLHTRDHTILTFIKDDEIFVGTQYDFRSLHPEVTSVEISQMKSGIQPFAKGWSLKE